MTLEHPRFCSQCGTPMNGQTAVCSHCNAELDERFPGAAAPMLEKMPIEKTARAQNATARLLETFKGPQSRRNLFKGALAASGVAIAGAGALYAPTFAMAKTQANLQNKQSQTAKTLKTSGSAQDTIVSILTVARTAEQLAVTFYSNGIANADKLGISGDNLTYLKAALVEEQIHQQFFAANGGQSLADTFSFPQGPDTFGDLKTFIATQQQLEGVFDSAFLAAIMEFAQLGRPDLAQIAGQVACIEAEHRALGRAIGGLSPADNWAFTPVLIASVGDAPALVQKAGYLSPKTGNSYMYKQVSIDGAGVEQTKPFSLSSGTVVGNG